MPIPMTPADRRVAGRVRGKMAELEQRQTDVAERLGLSQSALSRRLAGKQPFTYGELHSIAAVLGIDVDDLLDKTAAAS